MKDRKSEGFRWMVACGLAMVAVTGLTGCGKGPLKAGDTKTVTLPGGAAMEMVWCPPGTFLMGSPEDEEGRSETMAQRGVRVAEGFWLAKHEVIQGQWKSVMGDNPSLFDDDDSKPVERVGLDECREFCRKAGMKLPTREQWEYACRAGSSGAYAGTGRLGEMGWYSENSGDETHPVGAKKANAWGLCDMHGNVWELCGGGYIRGGGWDSEAKECRAAYEAMLVSGQSSENVGFRPACAPTETEMAQSQTKKQKVPSGQEPFQDEEGLAVTVGTGQNMKLAGMFGVEFGQVMPEPESCSTNDSGMLVHEWYHPEKPLEKFDSYCLFATPTTRQVFYIRATYAEPFDMVGSLRNILQAEGREEDESMKALIQSMSADAAEMGWDGAHEDVGDVYESVIRTLEERFGLAAQRQEGDQVRFLFADGNVVTVSKRTQGHNMVFIDAVNPELEQLARAEDRAASDLLARQYSADLRVLALTPARNGDEPMPRIDSVFGIAFGDPCRQGSLFGKTGNGKWVYTFEPDGSFMGGTTFLAVATARTRRVCEVQARFDEDSAESAKGKYALLQRLIERETGGKFQTTSTTGGTTTCQMMVGEHEGIVLKHIWENWENQSVSLSFIDTEVSAGQ